MGEQVQVYTLRKGEGAYSSCGVSGLITGVAADNGTTAGHIWTVRWAPASPQADKRIRAVVTRLRARWFTIAGFTGAQEIGFKLWKLTADSALPADGTALVPTKRGTSPMPTAIMAGKIAAAAALTAGTQTIAGEPIRGGAYAELAAAATVPKGAMEIFLSSEDLDRHPLVLESNEGLLITNTIAMGAGGTARLFVEFDWLEVARF